MTGLFAPLVPGELRDGDLRLELADYAMHQWNKVPTYFFRMVHAHSGEELGRINLRVGSTAHVERYGGHIGFDVTPAHRGHRLAARSVRLLIPLARQLGLDPLWITRDPENAASRRTLEIAGAEFVEIVDVPEDCCIFQSGHPRKCRYRLSTG
ncbi:MAG TPA: GNAT family N-acetyltransferase [Terracidiphilus sp.]|nr:GNAT family N-acetyltransferase [Terracidiphilus sp.]